MTSLRDICYVLRPYLEVGVGFIAILLRRKARFKVNARVALARGWLEGGGDQ